MGLFIFVIAGIATFLGLFAIAVLLMVWIGKGKTISKRETL